MNQPVEIANYLPIDFETFADAPYSFICPDGPTVEEQDKLSRDVYDALRDALYYQDSARVLGDAYSTDAATRTAYYLSLLGFAVLRVAESRGLTCKHGDIVQEADA